MKNYALVALALTLFIAATPVFGGDEDNYENAYMPRGRYQGQLLDTRDRRSIRIFTDLEASPYRQNADDIIIANFYHEGKFWIARFPADGVDEIFFHKVVMKTKVPAAHAQLRFKMKKGHEIELYAPAGAAVPTSNKISDVVYSVEAMPVYGDKYDLFNGVRNHFGLGLRFMSIEEAYFKSIYLNDQHVEQIPLSVLPNAEQTLLREALVRSDTLGMAQMYNTLTRSCCTESFGLLDRSSARTWLRMPAYGLVVLPMLPRTYLWLRQLIDFGTLIRNQYPSLEEEFAHLKETVGWSARKAALLARDAADRSAFATRMNLAAQKCDLDAFSRRNQGPDQYDGSNDGAE